MRKALFVVLMCSCISPATAQVSLLDASLFARPSNSLVDPNIDTAHAGSETKNFGASLFLDRQTGGMFAKIQPKPGVLGAVRGRSGIQGLRDLIARAEAGRGDYDAVQHGARIKPRKSPTDMTIAEIYAWIDATPGQPHAIGRYQFIPKTLRYVVGRVGVSTNARFSPAVQDALADVLFAQAGIDDFLAGRIDQTRFMNNLAKIWAGFPTSNGKSYYHGYAGNRATMTWAQFNGAMSRIFPAGRS